MKIRIALLFLFTCFLFTTDQAPLDARQDGFIRSDRLGIAHISSSGRETPASRYQQALRLGAGWNRWPIYWDVVETEPGTRNWAGYDRQVINDLDYGLEINAILIGSPVFFRDGDRIQGINEPIFADGSDTPGAGKAFNPNNPWVSFVWDAVNRYKPGGVLAQSAGFNGGIRVWEIWNEPDFDKFWRAGSRDYARLLKISYIVIKMADPEAQVMFGGLLFPDGDNMLAEVLNIFINDPQREANNWYMDLIGVHSYADPWRSGWLVLYLRQTLIAFDLQRPIWLNESGVPVWDDYPGPTWEPTSTNRATLEQQAWYFVQSSAYAWTEGADKVFLHQLYDDCGDQPAGTDFPPHDGDLCVAGRLCYGDAHGIYRNPGGADCFSQHPLPGTPRPLARAYRLVADVFGTEPFARGQYVDVESGFVAMAFDRTRTNERVTVIWNRRTEIDTLDLPAVGTSGQLISMNSNNIIEPIIRPEDQMTVYQITLPAALEDTDRTEGNWPAIGGEPYLLIEQYDDSVNPADLSYDNPDFDSTLGPPDPLPTAAPTLPPVRPTVDPMLDNRPPEASVLPLDAVSPATFTVTWQGQDDSGIATYVILVRVDDGEWTPWLETTETSATYTGAPGKRYAFAAWAVDLAGNWSTNINPQPQATTQVE